MGAATVLNCNEMSPPDQVKIIIEDCGFTSAEAVMNNTLKDMIGFKFMPIVKLGSLVSKVKAGYFFSESDPLKNMGIKQRIPFSSFTAKRTHMYLLNTARSFTMRARHRRIIFGCPTPFTLSAIIMPRTNMSRRSRTLLQNIWIKKRKPRQHNNINKGTLVPFTFGGNYGIQKFIKRRTLRDKERA